MSKKFQVPEDRFADSDGVKLRYRVAGSGEPLLLIMGYGPPSTLWHFRLPYLIDDFQCAYYDHRGTGSSDTPDDGYDMEQFARDARAVMDAMGWESAHVYGASMGGMIAQQLALDAPERIRTLVLGSTTCGEPAGSENPAGVPGVAKGMNLIAQGKFEEGFATVAPILYGDLVETRPDIIATARKILSDEPPRKLPGFSEEPPCLMGWNVEDRLGEIQCPTLVMHAHEDRVFPTENAWRIFEGLPNAQLRVQKAPHAYTATDPSRVLGQIKHWILSQDFSQGETE